MNTCLIYHIDIAGSQTPAFSGAHRFIWLRYTGNCPDTSVNFRANFDAEALVIGCFPTQASLVFAGPAR